MQEYIEAIGSKYSSIYPWDGGVVIVRAKSYSRVYGDENPVFELDLGGSSLEGVPELLCTANATSPVGTYTIEVRKGTIKNEDVLFENGSLTITKAPLTISVGNYTKKQGDAMPTFKASYTGFKNGEDESVLIKQPVFETTATAESALFHSLPIQETFSIFVEFYSQSDNLTIVSLEWFYVLSVEDLLGGSVLATVVS